MSALKVNLRWFVVSNFFNAKDLFKVYLKQCLSKSIRNPLNVMYNTDLVRFSYVSS